MSESLKDALALLRRSEALLLTIRVRAKANWDTRMAGNVQDGLVAELTDVCDQLAKVFKTLGGVGPP